MSEYERGDDMQLEAAEQRALEALLAVPRLSEGDWDRLHRNIVAGAGATLARRGSNANRRSRLLRPAILSLAAAATFFIVFRMSVQNDRGSSDVPAELTASEEVLLMDVPDAQFTRIVSGGADAEALLLMAVSED